MSAKTTANPKATPASEAAAKPTPLELASAACAAQGRLRKDVHARFDAAADALERADRAHSEAVRAHDDAMAKSAAARADDTLADQAARAAVRRDHARRDLEQLAEAHEQLRGELAAAKSNYDAAGRAEERERLWEKLAPGKFLNAAREDALAIVGAVLTLLEAVPRIRQRIAKENELVAQFHAVGGALDFRPRDGTAQAGALFEQLLADGGCLHVRQPHQLRYICDVPGTSSPLRSRFESVRQLVGFLIGSLEQAHTNAVAGIPDRGVPELKRVAEVFLASRERVEASERIDALDAALDDAREAAARRAHELRLAAQTQREMGARQNRGRGHRADGSVIQPPEPLEPPDVPDVTVG